MAPRLFLSHSSPLAFGKQSTHLLFLQINSSLLPCVSLFPVKFITVKFLKHEPETSPLYVPNPRSHK